MPFTTKGLITILILTTLSSSFALTQKKAKASKTSSADNTISSSDKTKAAPFELIFNTDQKKADSQITVAFTGDVLIHEDLYKDVIEKDNEDFSDIWKSTAPLIKQSDFSYANMEGPTALGIDNKLVDQGDIGFDYDGEIYSGTHFLFNYHPQLIDALKKTGFDILSTSNNHSLDRGAIGIDRTIKYLKEKKMAYVGTRKKDSSDPFYTITPIKDFKIAWIACTEMINGFKDKKSQLLLCYDQSDEVLKIIQKIKSEKLADLIILLPHWGEEYVHQPNENQKKYAHIFAEAGADIIAGSHPHVLQPIEKFITKDNREVFIAYSLGNFVAYQRDVDRRTSAFVYLTLSKDKTKSWISGYSYQPTVRVDKQIRPAAKMPDIVEHAEKYLGKFKP